MPPAQTTPPGPLCRSVSLRSLGRSKKARHSGPNRTARATPHRGPHRDAQLAPTERVLAARKYVNPRPARCQSARLIGRGKKGPTQPAWGRPAARCHSARLAAVKRPDTAARRWSRTLGRPARLHSTPRNAHSTYLYMYTALYTFEYKYRYTHIHTYHVYTFVASHGGLWLGSSPSEWVGLRPWGSAH